MRYGIQAFGDEAIALYGTTALVALENARKFIGIELNQKHIDLTYDRLKPLLSQETPIITN